MEIVSILISSLSALIATAAAWISWRTARPVPRIEAKITVVLTTQGTIGFLSSYKDERVTQGTFFVVHVQLANLLIHPVQLMDHDLIVTTRTGRRVKMKKPWSVSASLNMSIDGIDVIAKFTEQSFMNWPPQAVGYGELKMGFLAFIDEGQLRNEPIREYELTLRDVFGRSYEATITSEESDHWSSHQREQSINIATLFDSAGVKLQRASLENEYEGGVARD